MSLISAILYLSFFILTFSHNREQKSGRILVTVLGLIGLYITFSFLQSLTTFALTIRASKRLHDKMVAAILRAKIEFFDTNPSGR